MESSVDLFIKMKTKRILMVSKATVAEDIADLICPDYSLCHNRHRLRNSKHLVKRLI